MTSRDGERLESRRLAATLRRQIEEGVKYPPGTRLPSFRQLAVAHHVARNTVGAALRLLEEKGLVEIRPASGAYVRDPAVTPDPQDVRAELKELCDQLQRIKHELAIAQKTVTRLLEYLPREE